jgi:hypothetical protein
MYGVLGIDNIEDEEGTGAYYVGKDLNKTRPFGLKLMFPNLHEDYGTNKKNFESAVAYLDKYIKHSQ